MLLNTKARSLLKIKALRSGAARSSRGDTIIEVLISVTVLGLVLAASFSSAGRSLSNGTDAANRNQAVAYAQDQIELIRSAADNGKLASFPTDGTAFCVDPATEDKTSPDTSGYCHFQSQSPFGVMVTYKSANQTFKVVSQWQGSISLNQVQLYYQLPLAITDAPNVDINISASPSVIPYNGSTTINWSTTTAMSCVASGAWTGSKPTSGSESFNNLTTTGIYSLTCQSTDGKSSLTRSAKVNVSQLPAPTVVFNATPDSISYGGSSKLNWSTTNAVSCTASGDWSGDQTLAGSWGTGALTASKSYTLECVGSDGVSKTSVTSSVKVAPPPAPTLSFYADSTNISYDSSTTLHWSATNATTCTASGSWSGDKGTSSSSSTGNLTSSQTYTLSCSGITGTTPASGSVTVSVGAKPAPPPSKPSCSATAGTSGGGPYLLSGGGSGCAYYMDTQVGWNGGFSGWSSSNPCHTQYGGADPWGFYASQSAGC